MYRHTRQSQLTASASRWAAGLTTAALLVFGLAATGCFEGNGRPPSFNASYAEILPSPEDVELRVPADESSSSALTLGDTARFYQDTYHITRAVNGTVYVTLTVLGSVVRLPPSEVGDDYAVWGPYTPALEPATYMLIVSQVGPEQYEYALMARPRTSTSDDDFAAIIQGQANTSDQDDNVEGKGAFVFDWTALARINPMTELEGRMTVAYEHRPLQWRSVEMVFEGLRERQNGETEPIDVVYRYLESADTSGELQFATVDNVHGPFESRPEPEVIEIRSRWTAGGAGRSDARITGAEIAADLAAYASIDQDFVQASECWDDGFLRTYYDESPVRVSPDDGELPEGELDGPGQGVETDCVYTEPLFPDEDVTVL